MSMSMLRQRLANSPCHIYSISNIMESLSSVIIVLIIIVKTTHSTFETKIAWAAIRLLTGVHVRKEKQKSHTYSLHSYGQQILILNPHSILSVSRLFWPTTGITDIKLFGIIGYNVCLVRSSLFSSIQASNFATYKGFGLCTDGIGSKHFFFFHRLFHFIQPNRLFSILYTGSNHGYNSFYVRNNFIEWILIMNMMNFWSLFIFKSLYLDGLPHIIIITALIMVSWIGRIKNCRRMWAEIQSIKLRRHSMKICQKMSSVFFFFCCLCGNLRL